MADENDPESTGCPPSAFRIHKKQNKNIKWHRILIFFLKIGKAHIDPINQNIWAVQIPYSLPRIFYCNS